MTPEEISFSAVSELDSAAVMLEDVRNALSVFDEFLTDEVRGIKVEEAYGAACFVARFPLAVSMLSVIQFRLWDIIKEMNDTTAKLLTERKSQTK